MEGSDLDSELHFSWRTGRRIQNCDGPHTCSRHITAGRRLGGPSHSPHSPLYFWDSSVSRSSSRPPLFPVRRGRGWRKSFARWSAGSRGCMELQGVECSSGGSAVEPSLTRRMWKSQTVAENQTFSLCSLKSFGLCQIVFKYLCLRGNEAASPQRPPTVAAPPADRPAAPQSEEPSAEPPTWSETPPHSAILTTTLKSHSSNQKLGDPP